MPGSEEQALRLPLALAEAREITASLTLILDTAWEIKATLGRYNR